MALPKWIIENDLCRCCHSEGPYLNLAQPRTVDGEIKVYSKMLQECFDIVVSPVNGVLNEYTYSICGNCTNKVRDALSFKQQVLECEKKFENMYSKNCIFVSELLQEVKTEIDISDHEVSELLQEVKSEIDISDNEVSELLQEVKTDIDVSDAVKKPLRNGCSDLAFNIDKITEPENVDDNDDPIVSNNDDGLEDSGDELRLPEEPENVDEIDDLLVAKNDDGFKVSGDQLRLRRVKGSCKRVMQDTDYVKVGREFRCNHCSNAYMRRQSVISHIRLCHYELLKESQSQFGMTAVKHVGGNENNEKYYKRVGDLYTCTHCNETFKCSRAATRHIRMAHYTMLKYVCKHCNERFGCQSSLTKHTVQAHKIEKPLKDSLKRVIQNNEYVRVGQKFRCNHCSKTYIHLSSVKFHIRMCHYEVVKGTKYVGGNVNHEKDYKRVGDLYSCTHCNETFKCCRAATRHIRMAHYKMLKYACQYCNERFGYSNHLTKHTFQAHKIDERRRSSSYNFDRTSLRFIFAMYYYAVSTLNLNCVTHKFLIRGHTQNEGDHVHSTIEKSIKRAKKSGPIYVPSQYVQLIRNAKKTGKPYKVQELNFDDFIELKSLADDLGLNTAKDIEGNSIKVSEIKMIEFSKNSETYKFKTSYDQENWTKALIKIKSARSKRINKSIDDIQLKPAYSSKISITERKKTDLLQLVSNNIIPKQYNYFYDSLI